ncbi:sigma-54 interaction domain-containing protein [Desulfovermiculus halophilus]|uniref:sigma-54 interaction domain-containing protein n=1 Tax=Desulfovermiculus halophilus TaxID=339722 RepID=UPI0004804D90|nr:sigma 54-interacting transcriptional regulator [Desulfovermiculus halophilus]
MSLPPDSFFRESVLRICSSLDIDKALDRCLEYVKQFIPADSMHLSVYLPDVQMLEFVAAAGNTGDKPNLGAISVPAIDWEAPENQRPGMTSLHMVNNPHNEPETKNILNQLEMSLDFSAMIMRLSLEQSYIGEVAVKSLGINRFTEDHARLFVQLREPLAIALANALKHMEVVRLNELLADESRYFQQQIRAREGEEVIGADFGLKGVMQQVQQVASLDNPVLLLGETGSGKGIIADTIHKLSNRSQGPMITVNCGAIPDALLESELFGHEKGAFTGAEKQKRGRFERGQGGTVFLDEIGELPFQSQVKLLHVLQHKQIERVGGSQSIPLDIRIIAATNRDLAAMVRAGDFREDLWYRLNVFPVMVPPLRQRKEDIPALVHHFLHRKAADLKLANRPKLPPDALDKLMAHTWPGNVRELENFIERALIQSTNSELDIDSLITSIASTRTKHTASLEDESAPFPTLDAVCAEHIRRALNRSRGKISGPGGAAELLDLHPNTLRQRMDKLGIPYKRRKQS